MEDFSFNFKKTKLFNELQTQIINGNLSHATLISSPDEMSLECFTNLLANTLVCNQVCENCEHCIKVKSRTHPDILTYPKGKNFLVSDALDIVENAYKKPILSDFKVIIINGVDQSVAGQNKILKILEEPPKNVFFILSTTNTKTVLDTIMSRVQAYSLAPFKQNELVEILALHNIEANNKIISFSEGFLGKAISLKQNPKFDEIFDFVYSIFTQLKSSKDIVNYSKQLADKENFALELELLFFFYRQALYFLNHQKTSLDIDFASLNLNNKMISQILKCLCEAEKALYANVNLNLICDNLLLHILEEKYLWK